MDIAEKRHFVGAAPLPMTNPAPGSSAANKHRWVILALLFFATTINYIDRQILALLKPMLDSELKWSNEAYGYINSAFQGAYALGLLGFGWFIDRFGVKIGYAVSIGAWSLAAMAHALVNTVGGFFWDGRVNTLAEQAIKPFLGANEMANASAQEVVDKLSRASYVSQFKQVFGVSQPHPDEVLTLTLALSLPAGAGLRLWVNDEPLFHAYQLGHLVLHNGLMPHQAVLHPLGGTVPRVMLQCHGLLRDGAWVLYW